MSYIKQTWANGDIITAAKLNHIEDGIASSSNVVIFETTMSNPSSPTFTSIDYQECLSAINNEKVVLLKVNSGNISFFDLFSHLNLDTGVIFFTGGMNLCLNTNGNLEMYQDEGGVE